MDIRHDLAPPARVLRIALVTETYAPEINGVAMTLQRLVGGLCARGHEVAVIRPRLAGGGEGEAALAVPSLPIPGYAELRFGLPARRRLGRHFDQYRPDVLYVATEGPLGASALTAARRRGIPVLSGFHTQFQQYARHYRIGFLQPLVMAWLRRFHRRTALTLVPDADLCRRLEAEGFGRLAVLPRGVDARLFDPRRRDPALRVKWGAGPADPVALCVGRVAPEKNLELFVAAVQAMRRAVPDLRAVVVGDGPLRAALQRRHPWLHFAGARTGEDLAAHFASADLFLFPSLTETFGNVVLEALASGLAVLAFDYAAAHRHIRNGENGFVVPFGDRAAFLEAAVALAARGLDDLAGVRAQARLGTADLDWQRIVIRFERLLESVLPAVALS